MKFVIQELLNNYKYVKILEETLKKKKIDYYLLSINKENKGVFIDTEYRIPLDNQDEIMDSLLKSSEGIFVYGGKGISNWAKLNNLIPGTFESDKLNFSNLPEELHKHLLNDSFEIGPLSTLNVESDKIFIRPDGNNKLISGCVMTKKEFEIFKKENKKYEKEIFVISKLKKIDGEYRFFVINDVIISSSKYAQSGRYDGSNQVPKIAHDFAENIISKYHPANAYVLDVAECNGEMKIVEYNNINCSAFYEADVKTIVDSIIFHLEIKNKLKKEK